ncbi:MAG: nuclear transport factor 2 family protein [Pedobacter sp.]|nr:MAG: nuclear transport factor 2 family protein [Pedobacter sp.]
MVSDFINALNKEDFDTVRRQLADDMTFEGVMGKRNGADIYIEDMKKMKLKYNIRKMFVDDNEVSVWYDINMGDKTILASGWYKLEDEKIKSFRVLFDPRPLL